MSATDVGTHTEVTRAGTTVCPFCGGGCRVLIHQSTAFPVRHDTTSGGALCLRGWSAGEVADSPARLTRATLRSRAGPVSETPVDAALAFVAARLAAIRDWHGGASIGILGSARLTLDECSLLRRLAGALGTPHLDSLQRHGCTPVTPLPYDAIDTAARITVVGADLAARHPVLARRVLRARERGADVTVIHPRAVKHARAATRHLRPLPGHEMEELQRLDDPGVVIVSSDLALSGQGAALAAWSATHGSVFAADYVNQRGLVDGGVMPGATGWCAYEMLQAAARGTLRALLVVADDPFEFFPALAAEAFARAELTVVADAYRTGAARRADVALPTAAFTEKSGRAITGEGRAVAVSAVAPARGEWSEARVLGRLLESLGDGGRAHEPAPLPQPIAAAPDDATPSPDFPFLLALDPGTLWTTHAQVLASVTAGREAAALRSDFPSGYIALHPDDAFELRVRQFDRLTIESPLGVTAQRARFDARLLRGTLAVPMQLWETVGATLGALGVDAALRIPVFRPVPVRVLRLARVEK